MASGYKSNGAALKKHIRDQMAIRLDIAAGTTVLEIQRGMKYAPTEFTHSAPGESPMSHTGALRASIGWARAAWNRRRIGSGVGEGPRCWYAALLEFGTNAPAALIVPKKPGGVLHWLDASGKDVFRKWSRGGAIEARPFIRPGMQRMLTRIDRILRGKERSGMSAGVEMQGSFVSRGAFMGTPQPGSITIQRGG